MTLLKLLYLLFILSSCINNTRTSVINDSLARLDTLAALGGKTEAEWMDSVRKVSEKSINKSLMDTAGVYKSGVKVLSAKLFKEEYSSYRSIRLSYKNVSNKKISAIKFKWYGVNAFDDPADMGSPVLAGFGGGFTDDPLSPNQTESGEWSILSRDGKKVVLAWPIEVVFADGTKWKLN